MKLLPGSVFCIMLTALAAAQTVHSSPPQAVSPATQSRAASSGLPQTTLQFKPVSDAVAISAENEYLVDPHCSADGTFYFNELPVRGHKRGILALSLNGEVANYSLNSVPGLANMSRTFSMDVDGSDVYVLVTGETSKDLLDHDIQPSDWVRARRYDRYFLLRFHGKLSVPDLIPLDLSIQPSQFAVLNKDEIIFLGYVPASLTPVLAVVDGEGQFQYNIDIYHELGGSQSIIANWRQVDAGEEPEDVSDRYRLGSALSDARFAHQGDSLLLLMPGPHAKILTIGSRGDVHSMALHLPGGVAAGSVIPSAHAWYVRPLSGYEAPPFHILFKVDPSTGDTVQIIHLPQRPGTFVSCVRGGDFYGISRSGKEGSWKTLLIEAVQ